MREKRLRRDEVDSVDEICKVLNEVFDELRQQSARIEQIRRPPDKKKGKKGKMMRKIVSIILLAVLFTSLTYGTVSVTDIRNETVTPTDNLVSILRSKITALNDDIAAAGGATAQQQGTGEYFYVDSAVGSDSYVGTSWAAAKATLDGAVALCDADDGDVIFIATGHTEDWTAADSADLDIAGITVIGLGEGENRPLFTLDGADAELVMGDASIVISNLRFMASVDSTVHIIEVEADADGFVIYNCEFMEPESGNTTDEADDIIQVAAGANQGYILNNIFYSASAGANTAVDLTAGVIEDITVAYNLIIGDFAEAGIFSDDIDLRARIIGNIVTNTNATGYGIEFDTTASGWMIDNLVASKSTSYMIDPGSMQISGNKWIDTDSGDVSAVEMFTNETGIDIWSASQVAQIEAEATDALEADHLDHLAAVSVADEIANESFLADLTSSTQDWSTFVASTDSLQAIADHVQTLITTGAGTGNYPTGVTNESIIAFILAKGATATASTYNNTTDSLEAISDKITALEGMNFMATATGAGSTSTFVSTDGGDGFGDDYFNTGWSLIITYDAGAIGAAPEGDVRDIVDYVSTTGTFTVAPVMGGATATGDKAIVVRHETLDDYASSQHGGSGKILYVDASQPGTPDTGDIGKIWDLSYTTIALAIAGATASNGDVILVAAGHTETIADAQLTWNVAGVKIIGLGVGSTMPIINFNHANASIDVTAADVYVEGLRFRTIADDVLVGIDLAATSDGFHIKNCIFDAGTATDEFLETIEFKAAAAANVTIEGCQFYADDTADATEAIISEVGASDNTKIIGNTFIGSWVVAPVYFSQAHTNMLVKDNVIQNLQTGQHAFEATAACTGMLVDNVMYGDTITAILDPGSLICTGNVASISADEAGIPIPLSADTTGVTAVNDGSNLERLELLQRQTEDTTARLGIDTTTADVWYVDSVSASGGDGTEWAQSEDTLKAAIDDATNSVGAYIFVAPGHAEATITASIAMDCPGITVVGMGTEALRPTFTFTGQNGDIAHTVADVTWINCLFISDTADTDECMILDGSSDGATFIDCEWRSTGAFEFVSTVTIASGCDDVVFKGCKFNNATAGVGNATAAITNIAGVTDGMVIEDCEFYGAWTSAAIFSDDADTDVMVRDCIVQNTSTGIHAIEFSAAALGSLINNMLYTDSVATVLDPGSLKCYGNKQATAIDAAAIDVPLVAGKTYAMSASVDEVDATIFDVQNGEIIISSFIGLVDVVIGGNATTCQIQCNADDGAAWDVEFSTAVAITTDAAGTRYVFSDANPSVLTPLLKGVTEGSSQLMSPWFCPEGLLLQEMSADPGGAAGDHITWYMIFTPVSDGVIVVPQ